jgi:hypothetical protein
MVKIVEMDENVTLKASSEPAMVSIPGPPSISSIPERPTKVSLLQTRSQLEEDVGSVILLNKFTKFDWIH